jgi:hypothetical protein
MIGGTTSALAAAVLLFVAAAGGTLTGLVAATPQLLGNQVRSVDTTNFVLRPSS